MRHGTTNRRQRSRGNGGRNGGQPRMQVFDSNGPDVRIRGTAHQVAEKYMTLAKDASVAGDRILSESYLQHAEHYQRVINRWESESGQKKDAASDTYGENARFYKDSGKDDSNDDGDLSLPSSIIGADAKAGSEQKSGARSAQPAGAE